jgi:DNA polymerase (family 10)
VVWKELNIESIDQLYDACQQGKLEKLKGFGAKTQQTILENLEYLMSQRGKALYADAEPFAEDLLAKVRETFPNSIIQFTGAMRRKVDVLECVELISDVNEKEQILKAIIGDSDLIVDQKSSGPFSLRGSFSSIGLKWHIRFSNQKKFLNDLMLSTGSDKHLSLPAKDGTPFYQHLLDHQINSEKEAYEQVGMSYLEPELREGIIESSFTIENQPPDLLKLEDLKGPFHNHSNYSDGANTVRQLAEYCIEQGYEYLGLSDHSKSAFYANGLQEFQVAKQHEEIDTLNNELAPFKIFKGIESDILNDGSLDYEKDVLASFDFIVASVHSNLNMDIQKATQRLIKAIENPYTTFLGHPTGRLLLRRKGYPIDHKKIIEACAANNVIIEINANPWRLDIDWRWVHLALEKGVVLSINPDAHEIHGFEDMKYGVYIGRKGGLTSEMTFNAWSLKKVESYLKERKSKIQS